MVLITTKPLLFFSYSSVYLYCHRFPSVDFEKKYLFLSEYTGSQSFHPSPAGRSAGNEGPGLLYTEYFGINKPKPALGIGQALVGIA